MEKRFEKSPEQSASQSRRRRKLSRAELRIRLRLEPFNLTKKETEITVFLVEGMKRDEILDRCDITNNTLKTHIRRIYQKLGVGKRSEIASRLALT
jgi:DNA-binding CsgD family transcriptional regulator